MSLERKKLSSVLIKPAGPDCNMACAYCFYLEKSELFPESRTHRMNDQVLEETVRQVMTQGQKQVSFSWNYGIHKIIFIDYLPHSGSKIHGSAVKNLKGATPFLCILTMKLPTKNGRKLIFYPGSFPEKVDNN